MLRLAALLVIALTACPLAAQPLDGRVTVSTGAAVPVLGMAGEHHPGPIGQVSVRALRWLRVDASASWNDGRYSENTYNPGDRPGVRTGSVLAQGIIHTGGSTYALVGVAAHRQRLTSSFDPYGWVPGVQVGAGAELDVAGLTLVPEVQAQVVLSDLTSGQLITPSVRLPLVLGVQF
jgi:hypothetical protein